jgi:hypothetical protein
MVSAVNGSILAHSYRDETPSIKQMRTQSTTMTAAYTVASEDTLVFEAQNMGATSVITPIADHILLAVTGPTPRLTEAVHKRTQGEDNRDGLHDVVSEGYSTTELEDDEHQQLIRTELELVCQELASNLRSELASMRWPEDI